MAQYDVVIIGSGPGGEVAALRAVQLGLKVAVVERDQVGGVCLNIGCIPTKALLHCADLLEETREGKKFGVVTGEVKFELKGAMGHKERVVKTMRGGLEGLFKNRKIDLHRGTGRVVKPGEVAVTGADGSETILQTRAIILAVGSTPRALPFAPFDEQRIISSTGALSLPEVPRHLAIIGAGAIGCEFASMYRAFGAQVSLIEMLPRIVPAEDEEISAELEKEFKKRGIKIYTGAKTTGVAKREDGLTVAIEGSDGKAVELDADYLLVGVGRAPNTQNIGIVEAGVQLDQRGYVVVDGMMRTNVEGIYAIGDVVPTPWLAHVASAEGVIAVEHIAGHTPHPIDYGKIPGCTYCSPEVASVGLTERQAREAGYEVKVGKFPFAAVGKATVLGQRTGFVKLVSDAKYGELLGVHMIGPRVTELIAEGGLALSHEATVESLLATIHAHPTLYEALHEAGHALLDGPIHF
ncbi:MAG TPA: dihydrolipoyl dehydrogenase [Herpetosiphonaceae bacterium]